MPDEKISYFTREANLKANDLGRIHLWWHTSFWKFGQIPESYTEKNIQISWKFCRSPDTLSMPKFFRNLSFGLPSPKASSFRAAYPSWVTWSKRALLSFVLYTSLSRSALTKKALEDASQERGETQAIHRFAWRSISWTLTCAWFCSPFYSSHSVAGILVLRAAILLASATTLNGIYFR